MKRWMMLAIVATVALLATSCLQGNVFDLTVGQCFNDPGAADEVSDVPLVECTESHDNEVYFLFNIPGDDWPGDEAVSEATARGCFNAFEDYVGIDYADSIYDIDALTPTQQGWNQLDDREVICYLVRFEGGQTVGTAKDSRQ